METPPTKPRRLTPGRLGIIAVLAAVVGLFVFAGDEIDEALWDLRIQRWVEHCEENPDALEACGRAALHHMGAANSGPELRQAYDEFQRLCDARAARACFLLARVQIADSFENFGVDHFLYRERDRQALAGCGAGDVQACAIVSYFDRLDDDHLPALTAACDEGDPLACTIAAQKDETPERKRAACDSGVTAFCEPKPVGTCLDGNFSQCVLEADDAAGALSAAPDPKLRNPAMYGVEIPAKQLVSTCDSGSAAACFIMGINATSDVNPFEEPVPERSLEITMGRACEMGANIACYVYAVRLLDVGFRAERNTKRARALLDTACKRGHYDSCRLIRHELLSLPEEIDEAMISARAGCAKASNQRDCHDFVHMMSFRLGFEPWLRLESQHRKTALVGCTYSEAEACRNAGDSFGDSNLHVRSASVLGYGCRTGDHWSCSHLFGLAKRAHTFGMRSADELRAKICPQLPAACTVQE